MARDRAWWRRWAQWVVAGLLLIGLGVLWWQAPALYEGSGADPGAQATATATTRAGILAVIAAAIAAVGVWASLSETRRANLAADQRERYTSAIAQLGDDKLDVRLGGIYGLERIGEDSPRDVSTIVEVLCAYVRGHGRGPNDDSAEALEKHRPPTDVQAALTVICNMRRRVSNVPVDLSHSHLKRAILVDANLSGADVTHATLIRADLSRANLAHADLPGANLGGADLEKANLTDANLTEVNLNDAALMAAQLSKAYIISADLSGARLVDAQLIDTHLIKTDLSHTDLSGADLKRAELMGSDLDGANLDGANLNGADLRDTHGLTEDQLEQAIGDLNTRLPNGLTRPASWSRPTGGAANSSDGSPGRGS